MSRLPPALRRIVEGRARGLCEYCHSQTSVTGHDFTVDHILPEAHGGADDPDNFCLCCVGCNSHKQARTAAPDPRTARLVPLFHPRSDNWDKHFRWSPTGSRIIGRTDTGRATVDALRLNRPVLVQARKLWAEIGLHPPRRRPLQED
jgi:HNH endonuclease